MLSVNGSPLANPYELGLNWLAGSIASEETSRGNRARAGPGRGQTKTKSQTNSIVVRRDLSFASSSTSSSNSQSGGLHSRNNSQSGTLPTQLTHSRSNLRTGHPASQLGSLTVSARVAVAHQRRAHARVRSVADVAQRVGQARRHYRQCKETGEGGHGEARAGSCGEMEHWDMIFLLIL